MWCSRVVLAIDIWCQVRSSSGIALLEGLCDAMGLNNRVSSALVKVKVSWVMVQSIFAASAQPSKVKC